MRIPDTPSIRRELRRPQVDRGLRRRRPWMDVLLSATALAGAAGAAAYVHDMIARERRLCAYCIPAAAVSFAMVPLGMFQLLDAWREPRS